MQASTQLMARIVGPFLLILGIGVALRGPTLYLFIPAFFQDGPLVFVTAAFGLALGCVMVAAHHKWDSPAAIVITLVGWITLIRSTLLLLTPVLVATIAANAARIIPLPIVAGIVAALVGVWLTFVGWSARREIPS